MRSLCIMPVYNQIKELPKLLRQCRAHLECTELLIVDDGSDDGSEKIIRQSGYPFIRIENRQGVGHALIVGTRYALQKGFDVVVHMAGNGKMLPREMGRLLEPIRRREADYVWGSRYLPGGCASHTPLFRLFGIKYVFNLIPMLLFGKVVSDTTCGYRAYRTQILEDVANNWDHPWLYTYEFEYYVLAKVLLSRYRYREVPISMIYPKEKKDYSKITPFVSWWSMLKPWLFVRLGFDPKPLLLAEPIPSEIRR